MWAVICKLFGRNIETNETQLDDNARYVREYEDITQLNFPVIFANKLTTLTITESTVDVVGDNMRAKYLDGCLEDVWQKIKKVTARMLGTGGCAIVPYVSEGNIYTNIVSQDRIAIHEKKGNRITKATMLADSLVIGTNTYYRWTDYTVERNSLNISTRVTNSTGGLSTAVPQWEDIPNHTIQGVDRVLFAFIVSPVDNRILSDYYGVPITYGCNKIIEEVYECLKQIQREFERKEVKVFAAEEMFLTDMKTGERKLPSGNDLFIATRREDKSESMIDVFSPEIRESSYYTRLVYLFELLEKSVGTSKGILTSPETRGATATEIKAGIYDTYALISDIRANIENGIKDFLYACEVLANYYNLVPQGQYELAFGWSYSMIESSAETWQQLKDAYSMGIKGSAELRNWLNTDETIKESQQRVDEIKKSEPKLKDLLGE